MRVRRNGFTLIELLVVISIIAVLMSILTPALTRVRQQAKQTVCLSNMKQVLLGALTYEVDTGRLPTHVWELTTNAFGDGVAIPQQVTFGIVNTDYDVRSLYSSYVSINYFKCPLQPKWERDVDDVDDDYNIYTDFVISGGYWANLRKDQNWRDLTGPNKKPELYTKTSRDWTYDGKKFNVLFGDYLGRYITGSQLRTNHTGRNASYTKYAKDYPNSDKWVQTFSYTNYQDDSDVDSALKSITCNYAFADGSAIGMKGNDTKMVEVPHRRDDNYTYFLPHK